MSAEVFVSEPVLQVLRLYDGLIDEQAWTRTASEQIERLADRLLDGQREKLPGAAVELHNWLPNAGRRSTEDLFGQCGLGPSGPLRVLPRKMKLLYSQYFFRAISRYDARLSRVRLEAISPASSHCH